MPESTDSGTQDSETGENTQAAASNREESAGFLLRATRFIQTPLLVRQGQGSFRDSGEIRDIIITEDGRITHYLADLRNVEGYDSGLYLIEAAGIAVEPENAMLDLTSQPPEMTRVRDEKLIQQYYGNNAMRVTRLLGYEVQGADSRSIGSFSDVVFDPASRTASYIVLVNSGFLGIGSTYHALPFDRITFTPDSELARLDVTVDQLETIRGFDPDYWPVSPDSGRTTGEAAPPAGSQAQETEP